MVIATDAPVVGNGFELVSSYIAIDVLHASHFRTLRGVEPAVVPVEADWLVQTTRVKFQLHVVGFSERIADGKNIAAPRADRELAVLADLVAPAVGWMRSGP